MESLDSSETNGSTKAVLASGGFLHAIIADLVERGAPVYKGTAEATNHDGYIGLIYADGCVERISVNDGYSCVPPGDFLRMFKGKQLSCL